MKKYFKGALVIALVVVMVFGTAGCSLTSSLGGKSAKYKKYVQGLLDANFKAKYSDFKSTTNATQTQAENNYKETVENYKQSLLDNYLYEDELTDDEMARLETITKDLLAKTSYTVEKAKMKSGSYSVTVKVKPINYIDAVYDQASSLTEEYADVDYSTMSDAEYSELLAEWNSKMLDILEDNIDSITYADEVSVTVSIDEGSQEYSVPDDDWEKLESSLFYVTDEAE